MEFTESHKVKHGVIYLGYQTVLLRELRGKVNNQKITNK